ncbi:MAG: exodeoxyribonuclease V subunit gamma, partial [Defluviitaleaceae bacterium]|nr:exodeoxyribonuclease V subunit gamma [Defluviitaleaceae bacterium]
MRSFRFIFGRPGTGKSSACAAEIAAAQADMKTCVYIVPEQFSLNAEALLIEHTKGLFSAQVLSFSRLAHSVLREVGRGGLLPLDDVGKHLIIRKAVANCFMAGKLKFYKSIKTLNAKGFIQQLSTLFTEFNKNNITPQDLHHTYNTVSSLSAKNSLNARLGDLAAFFFDYSKQIENKYNTVDTTLDLLATKLAMSDKLKDAHVWIDGFNGFTAQEYRIIAALMRICGSITVSLTLDITEAEFTGTFHEINPYEPYAEVKATANRFLQNAFQEQLTASNHIFLRKNYRHIDSPDLDFLSQNYFNEKLSTKTLTENIKISAYNNINDETSDTAAKVYELLKKGYSPKDIGIVITNPNAYSPKLRAAFARHNIPLFIDDTRAITAHPLAEVCRCFLALNSKGFHYDYVFPMLKSNLLPFESDDVDILENYVLASGVRGRVWLEPWRYLIDNDEELTERVNKIRQRFVDVLAPHMQMSSSKTHTVAGLCLALRNFLTSTGVSDTLSDWIAETKITNPELAQINEQMWLRLLEILDISTHLFGDTKMQYNEFAELLETGFESVHAGISPPTFSHIMVGDVRRSRLANVRALFVLGLNDIHIPAKHEEGLISDDDRETLLASGLKLSSTGKQKALDELLNLYQILTKPSESLLISYVIGEKSGRPAFVVDSILKKFPNIETTVPKTPDDNGYGSATHSISAQLTETDISTLYGFGEKRRLNTSVSRLESYRQCPYMYFATNELKLKRRKMYQIENTDLGNILHDVLEKFTKLVLADDVDINDKTAINAEISEIIENTSKECVNSILLSADRFVHYKNRLHAVATSSISAMAEHLERSNFSIYAAEAEFGTKQSLAFSLDDGSILSLSGRIDRIDKAEINDKNYITVIDYKTGSREFSFAELWYGIQLQ